MKIQDVVTRNVLTIGPDSTVKEAAAILVENGVLGPPRLRRRGPQRRRSSRRATSSTRSTTRGAHVASPA